MDDQNVYEPPRAEGLELGKFESFGGWLRFLQVINYISVIFTVLMVLMVSVFFILDEYADGELFESVIAFIELIPDMVLAVVILLIIEKKNKDVPSKIIKYLGIYIVASIIVYAFVFYLYKTEAIVEKPIGFWGSVIHYWIWSSYFKKSKRVNVYYGENAVG